MEWRLLFANLSEALAMVDTLNLCQWILSRVDGLSVHSTQFFSFQRNAFANDTIPSESYISAVQAAHLGTLCGQSLPLAASLKHTLLSLVRLTGDLIV